MAVRYKRRCTCGIWFQTNDKEEEHCPECRKFYNDWKIHVKLSYKAMGDFLREIKEYNELNGTNLSYGQYEALKYQSKLSSRVIRRKKDGSRKIRR